MSVEEIRGCTELVGMEHLDAAEAKGNGVVITISHIGNWELFAQLVFLKEGSKFGTVFQAIRNPYINAFINKDRERLGVETFDRRRGFAGPTRLLREGGILGVLVDQHAGDAGIWVPLFDHLASTSPLAATLAARAEAEIVPIAITTIGVAKWRVTVSPPLPQETKNISHLTQAINQALEKQIRSSPPDWFWVHERWKTPKPKFLISSSRRGVYLPENTQLEPFRILIRSSNWLGDAVMSMPAVAAIKRGRPDARITILTQEKIRDLWVNMPEVDEIIGIRPGESIFSLSHRLKKYSFSTAVLMPNSLRSALEVYLAGIPRRVGYAGHRRSWLLDQIVKEKKRPLIPSHHADRFLTIARQLGGDGGIHFEKAKRRLSADKAIIGICPGAEYGAAKRWPVESFRRAMEIVTASHDVKWLIVGVAKDRPLADKIVKDFKGDVENLTGKTSLGALIQRMKQMQGLVTNDTGTMHLAASLGIPTVAIFGSTEPDLTGPLGDFHQVLRHQVECSPCFLRECPLDFRCMKEITSEEVAATIQRAWLLPAQKI